MREVLCAIFAALMLFVLVTVWFHFDTSRDYLNAVCINDHDSSGNVVGWHCTESH